jgi:hypothetical protein
VQWLQLGAAGSQVGEVFSDRLKYSQRGKMEKKSVMREIQKESRIMLECHTSFRVLPFLFQTPF